jgi:hypothetical protein
MPRTAVRERPRTQDKERREVVRELVSIWNKATRAGPRASAPGSQFQGLGEGIPYRVSVSLWKQDYDRFEELLGRLAEIA